MDANDLRDIFAIAAEERKPLEALRQRLLAWADRVDGACPCRDSTPCRLGGSASGERHSCSCYQKAKVTWTLVDCRWPGHAIAAEIREEAGE